jgi:hypothetical protein
MEVDAEKNYIGMANVVVASESSEPRIFIKPSGFKNLIDSEKNLQ